MARAAQKLSFSHLLLGLRGQLLSAAPINWFSERAFPRNSPRKTVLCGLKCALAPTTYAKESIDGMPRRSPHLEYATLDLSNDLHPLLRTPTLLRTAPAQASKPLSLH